LPHCNACKCKEANAFWKKEENVVRNHRWKYSIYSDQLECVCAYVCVYVYMYVCVCVCLCVRVVKLVGTSFQVIGIKIHIY
jgi:hypothetical protein